MEKYQDNAFNSEQADMKKQAYQYTAIIETTSDGYWVCDMQGNFLEVNNAFCKMSGYAREELLTMKISDIEAGKSPEETQQHIETIIKTGNDRRCCHYR